MPRFTESHVEEAALSWLEGLGYAVLSGPDISPDGGSSERASYADVILHARLKEALARINPHLPSEALEEVLKKVHQTETPSLVDREPPLAPDDR